MKKIIALLLFVGCFLAANAQKKTVLKIEGVYDPDTLAYEFYHQRTGLDIDTGSNLKLYSSMLDWMGVRYRFGGDTKKGIDCSGFCYAIYDEVFDKKIASNSRAIYAQSKEIPVEELKEGDFVFFKIRRSQISHIGIYLGNDKFIHASSTRGVIISDLNDPYYKRYFYKGGRLLGPNELPEQGAASSEINSKM